MTRIFVSYSRNDKTEVGNIVRLLRATDYDVWWDSDIPVISHWWAKICEQIEWCEIFIFFISEKSVQSPYCLTELKYATDRNRPILLFALDGYTQYTIPHQITAIQSQWFEYEGNAAHVIEEIKKGVAHIQWDQFKDNDVPRPPEPNTGSGSLIVVFQQAVILAENGHFDQAILRFRNIKRLDFETWGTQCDNWIRCVQLYSEINELINHRSTHGQVPNKWREYQKVTRRLDDTFDPFDLASKVELQKSTALRWWRIWMLVFAVALVVSILGAVLLLTRDDDPNQSSSPKSTATDDLFAAADTATSTLPASTDTSEPTNTFTSEPTNTNTPQPTDTYTPEPTDTYTPQPTDTHTPEPTNTYTPQPTDTYTPEPTSTYTLQPTPAPSDPAIALAENGVSSNAEWAPYIQEFNGVEMVLVPAGCFMMGSEEEDVDEQPIHQQCFNEPFWIDRTEVTNAQYGSTGCEDWSSQPNQPRNCINWFDARDYCESRDARLPTEREWEYAARGPDNLTYPWGNEFVSDNAIWYGNSSNETADVGSRPSGASWVSAVDMTGNVWEWVSSLYQPYDYNATDGREDFENSTDGRVLRGGSFNYATINYFRAAYRITYFPYFVGDFYGFRCARDYSSSELPVPIDAIAIVNVTTANLRSGPGTNYEIVGNATNSERLTIVEQIMANGELWYKVERPNNEYAWISSTVVDVQSE